MPKTRNKGLSIDKKLFNSSFNQIEELSRLKVGSYNTFQKEIKKAYKHPITKHILKGKLRPTSYSDLRNSKQSFYSNNLDGEIAWLVESIKGNAKILNIFFSYENEIQDLILDGKFNEGREKLHELNETVCYSFWGLSLEYFFVEEIEGTEGNWKLKNRINKICENPIILFFNQVLSKRAEKNISILDFSRSFTNDIRNVPKLELEYLNFKIAYHLLQDYEEYAFIAHADSNLSLIDRYLTLVNILTELISSRNQGNLELVENILEDLKVVDDFRLRRILEYVGKKELSIQNKKVFNVLENYSSGNYATCISAIPEILKNHKANTELWDIYLKSLIESNQPYQNIKFSKFLDEILFDLYKVYLVSVNSKEKAENLLKVASSLPNLSFSKQLTALVVDRIGLVSHKNIFNNAFCINSQIPNPLMVLHSDNTVVNKEFKELLTYKCVNFISGKENDENILKSEIIDFKVRLYQLRRAYGANDYEKCVNLYKKEEYKQLKNNLYVEEIVYIIYNSLIHLERHDEAINLYVDNYFLNKNLLNRIDSRKLIEKIISENYSMSGSINSAIFFALENLDNYYHFVAVEMWIESMGLELPSEINLNKYKSDLDKYLFILEHSCTVEVLEKFYYNFESKEEVIEERKKILSLLIQNTSNETEKYIDELSSITQKEKIQSLLKEVNSGRIRLDIEMISSDNEKDFEKSFNRNQLLSEFSKTNETAFYDSKKLLKNFLQALLENQSPTMDPSYLSFKNLFNEMVDSFLFNKKSGLDGELSTRIRHGELENQLRSVFDRKNLISKRDDSGKYTDLKYWNDHYKDNLSEKSLTSIQNALKGFSAKIDKMIQFLVKEQIQVNSENYPLKKHAFFNYHFKESYLKLYYENSNIRANNFEEFNEYVFSVLTLYTESYLGQISDYLNFVLGKKIDRELDNLKEELDLVASERSLAELSQNIIDAKVDLQNELFGISKWFVISDTAINKQMDVKTLIECSFELSNIQHPNTPIYPKINASEKIIFNYYKHFVFIFLNLIDNIRTHSKLDNEELNVIVSVENIDNNFTIAVHNNINENIDKEILKNKLDEIKNNWEKEIDYKRVNREGGTGFEKIKKILAYDIKLKNHKFDFSIQGHELNIIFTINTNLFS